MKVKPYELFVDPNDRSIVEKPNVIVNTHALFAKIEGKQYILAHLRGDVSLVACAVMELQPRS